ncbi:Gamma carbonic anhydrase 2, mitochondrial [Galdieria sulphuraria]|nr:Gamma carbonic anhydrase 2, mitochondrial [Galdieria sulphuraria]
MQGQSMDHLGIRVQGGYSYREPLSRHRQLMNIGLKKPIFEDNVFIAPNASVIGYVQLGANSSVGYGAVLRADAVPIVVVGDSHIGDDVVIHCTRIPEERGNPTFIGKQVIIGARSSIYSCTIYDKVYIGWGSLIEEDCVISTRSVIASGSRLVKGTSVPSDELWGGNPANYIRKLTNEELNSFEQLLKEQQQLAELHAKICGKTPDQVESERHMAAVRSRLPLDYLEYMREMDTSKQVALPKVE